jgi:hypothetical protein
MASHKRKVRCFAEKRGQQWQAFCIELNLAVQGDNLKEVTDKLHAMIRSYVQLAMEQNDPGHQRDMLFRPAPLSIQLRYWYVRAIVSIANQFVPNRSGAEKRHGRHAFAFHEQAGFC